MLSRVVEYRCCTEINQLDDIIGGHDAIVELEITVGKTHFVEVVDAIDNLPEYTVNLGSRHLARHDDREQIVRRILHDLPLV